MYIAPNSVIRILKNVPLDLTYDHTIYFSPDSAGNTAQYNYFVSKTKYTLTEQSYQRVKRGWMRVNIVADNLYDCNYLMFQNTNFPDPNAPGSRKWFYAFIKSVEYINNAVSEIEFEIDVMQTWNREYTLDYCFVDREHSATDLLGENTVEENLDIGESYVVEQEMYTDLGLQDLFACYADNSEDGNRVTNNYYTPLTYKRIATIANYTDHALSQALQNIPANSLICAYQYPHDLLEFITETEIRNKPKEILIDVSTLITSGYAPVLQGITIKNRKLLTAPYTTIRITNSSGVSQTYPLQYFDLAQTPGYVTFTIRGVVLPEPQIVLFPNYYKGITLNISEGINFDNYIVTPQVIDAYKQWWYENKYQTQTNGIIGSINSVSSGAIQGGRLGGAYGAVAGAAVGVASHIATSLAKVNDIKETPDSGKIGSQNNSVLLFELNKYGYSVQIICPIPEKIHIIDEYFTRYGYATHRTKIPNRNVRPHWTYTKTIGCTITGSVPCDDMKKICSIYDNGITFWKNGNEIGNYTLENSAISME